MKRLIFVLVSFFTLFSTFANPNLTNSSLTHIRLTSTEATPEVIKTRIEAIPTEIELRYSADVKKYIDADLKNEYGRKQLSELLGRCSFYLPIFEKVLKDAGLPEELKYIPVIESKLKEQVTSPRGAGGLWQIMPATARGYGMQVNASVDERKDPYKASEKACRILKESYDMFGDWSLALAAYNCGPGNVRKALRKAGGDPKSHTFWSIARFLPVQTRQYLPKFIAMVYVMNYYSNHDVKAATFKTVETDTLHISNKTTLRELAKTAGVEFEELKKLNPHFLANNVPGSQASPCTLILPAAHALAYKAKHQTGHPEEDQFEEPIFTETEEASATLAIIPTLPKETHEPVVIAAVARAEENRYELRHYDYTRRKRSSKKPAPSLT